MNSITAIIVDDHAAFRRSLRKFVAQLGRVEVIGEAADGRAALELTIKLRPQLVLMDICMPQMNGTDSCRAMKQDNAALTVVLYSADVLESELALAQGVADLCLDQDCLFDELPAWVKKSFALRCTAELGKRSLEVLKRRSQTISDRIFGRGSHWLETAF